MLLYFLVVQSNDLKHLRTEYTTAFKIRRKPSTIGPFFFEMISLFPFGLVADGGVAGRGRLFPRPGPDGLPVLLGAFDGAGRFTLLMLLVFI